jgi:hypothetical protein
LASDETQTMAGFKNGHRSKQSIFIGGSIHSILSERSPKKGHTVQTLWHLEYIKFY